MNECECLNYHAHVHGDSSVGYNYIIVYVIWLPPCHLEKHTEDTSKFDLCIIRQKYLTINLSFHNIITHVLTLILLNRSTLALTQHTQSPQ